jgi:hypothetical protein
LLRPLQQLQFCLLHSCIACMNCAAVVYLHTRP